MKTNNIFDHMDKDKDNISEQTVIEDTGVNTDRVREIFMNKVNESKKTNKKSKKKVFVVLAAAVAATLAVGTVTAGATGSFNNAFGQIFAGEAADGMYAGGNVSVKSDIVNIDFNGITGDKNEVYGLMALSNKDGKGFVENTDGYYLLSDDQNALNGNVHCTRSLADQLSAKLYYRPDCGSGAIDYYFKEDGTIEALISYRDDEFNIIGETLTFNEDHVLLCHTDKVFYTWDEFSKLQSEHNDENDPFWKDGNIIEQLNKKYSKDLKENQVITFDWQGSISIITQTKLDLGIEGSVKLNYKDTSVKFNDAAGKKTTYSGTRDMTVKELEVNPFSLKLDLLYPTNDPEELAEINSKLDPDAKNTISVTLKDGTTYTDDNCPLYTSDNMERLQYRFSENFKQVVINPQNITKIVYNGTVLYSK